MGPGWRSTAGAAMGEGRRMWVQTLGEGWEGRQDKQVALDPSLDLSLPSQGGAWLSCIGCPRRCAIAMLQ